MRQELFFIAKSAFYLYNNITNRSKNLSAPECPKIIFP